MTHKPMVISKSEHWVTRRKMVDVLTPRLPNLGLRKEKMGVDGGWGWTGGWSPFPLAIVGGTGSEGAGRGSTTAWTDRVSRVAMSDSCSGLEGAGGLRLSL